LQLDAYAFGGAGVPDYQRPDGTGLKAGVAVQRLRFELSGRLLRRWFYLFQGQYIGTDKRFVLVNNFVGLDVHPWLKVQIGNFRVPFTMENQNDPRFLGFMERSLTARLAGVPSVRDLGVMAWGGGEHTPLTWALGWFGGEGSNRPSTDNRGDVVGRVVLRPLYRLPGSLRDAHVGVSGRYGRRDRNYVQYKAPAYTTPGGYELWTPSWGTTEVRPSGVQSALGLELFVPYRRFDLRAEAVVVHDERREVDTAAAAFNNTERAGTLTGHTFYVELAYWVFGQPRFGGNPGNYARPRHEPTTLRSLSVTARYERVRLDYDSIARSYDDAGVLVPMVRRGALDAATTRLSLDAAQVAVSYYATRHLRVLLQWSGYFFQNDQIVAPGAKASAKDPDAKILHEVALRVQLSI
jgi:phosphate-selective porin